MAQPLPTLVTNPSDFLGKSDLKEVQNKQTAVLKASAKYRAALLALSLAAHDFASVLSDASRAKEFTLAADAVDRSGCFLSSTFCRFLLASYLSGAVRRVADLHDSFARRLKEFSDRIEREFEIPMIRCLDAHNQKFTILEKHLFKSSKDVLEKIKKGESEVKKKKSTDAQQNQAMANLGILMIENKNLRFSYQADIFAECVRHFMTFHNQCSNLSRIQSMTLGTQSDSGNSVYQALGLFPVAEVVAGKAPAQPTRVLNRNTGHISSTASAQPVSARSFQTQQSVSAIRRSSLDSLADEYHRIEKENQLTLTGGEPLPRPQSDHSQRAQEVKSIGTPVEITLSSPETSPHTKLVKPSIFMDIPKKSVLSNRSASLTSLQDKKKVHFTSTSTPLVHVQNDDDSVVDSSPTTEETMTISIQPTLTATLSTLYPHIFNSQNTTNSLPELADTAKTVSVSDSPQNQYLTSSQSTVLVKPPVNQIRIPKVYFPPQADVQSQMGSVVGDLNEEEIEALILGAKDTVSTTNSDLTSNEPKQADLVIAVHDFTARSVKEMGLSKGDVITVRKRQGTWMYGTKIICVENESGNADGIDRFRRGPPQKDGSVGWIPNAFVTKYVTS
ncbi:hypothetical protein HK096_005649 [Nowakowskiella sp. JEL0078]|nr:hypothetical protein HK096_005649 [Nowakowskiella sp. JEL0078]